MEYSGQDHLYKRAASFQPTTSAIGARCKKSDSISEFAFNVQDLGMALCHMFDYGHLLDYIQQNPFFNSTLRLRFSS